MPFWQMGNNIEPFLLRERVRVREWVSERERESDSSKMDLQELGV